MRRNRLSMLFAAFALMLAPIVASGHVVAQDDDPIIIGAPINLTGWMAAYDQPPLDGAQLAVEQINAAGGVLGRPLEIKVVDGKTDPATVGNAAIEVIEGGAEVLVTPCDFDNGAPAGQAAQEAGLVGVSFCASSPLYGSATLGDKQFTVSKAKPRPGRMTRVAVSRASGRTSMTRPRTSRADHSGLIRVR